MLKKFYQITIFPYTLFLLYLMFFGMGRFQFDENVIRIEPVYSTLSFIENTIRWWDIVRIVLGNVLMFIPFGFLGWVFPKLKNLKSLMYAFISAIFIVEGMQYFTRLGIFEIDDILLNSFGVFVGFQIRRFMEKKFNRLVL
ncbi:VanZ family protein [Chryseobacterium sp. Leaf394]|uniref:VanZ family protein n=1 Tax=Chryseobacterium sp. Leaf394 TaxID=1736361 RepID=UPI0006FD58F6|nr:VanZ family protein [Chryseobacterium sp. Leaf394]KQS89313.1 teicoplanin resistance protein VanZ [Chryseobacterium sp. Leaf394]